MESLCIDCQRCHVKSIEHLRQLLKTFCDIFEQTSKDKPSCKSRVNLTKNFIFKLGVDVTNGFTSAINTKNGGDHDETQQDVIDDINSLFLLLNSRFNSVMMAFRIGLGLYWEVCSSWINYWESVFDIVSGEPVIIPKTHWHP